MAREENEPRQTVTVDDFMAYGPCPRYQREDIERLFAGRTSVDLDFILSADAPARDKLHCIFELDLIPRKIEKELRSFAVGRLRAKRPAGRRRKDDPETVRESKVDRAKHKDTKTVDVLALCQAEDCTLDVPYAETLPAREAIAAEQLAKLKELLANG